MTQANLTPRHSDLTASTVRLVVADAFAIAALLALFRVWFGTPFHPYYEACMYNFPASVSPEAQDQGWGYSLVPPGISCTVGNAESTTTFVVPDAVAGTQIWLLWFVLAAAAVAIVLVVSGLRLRRRSRRRIPIEP